MLERIGLLACMEMDDRALDLEIALRNFGMLTAVSKPARVWKFVIELEKKMVRMNRVVVLVVKLKNPM